MPPRQLFTPQPSTIGDALWNSIYNSLIQVYGDRDAQQYQASYSPDVPEFVTPPAYSVQWYGPNRYPVVPVDWSYFNEGLQGSDGRWNPIYEQSVEGIEEQHRDKPRIFVGQFDGSENTEGDTVSTNGSSKPPLLTSIEENALSAHEAHKLKKAIKGEIVLAHGNTIVIAVPGKVDNVVFASPGPVKKVLDSELPRKYGYPRYDEVCDVSYFGACVKSRLIWSYEAHFVRGGDMGESDLRSWMEFLSPGMPLWSMGCDCSDCSSKRSGMRRAIREEYLPPWTALTIEDAKMARRVDGWSRPYSASRSWRELDLAEKANVISRIIADKMEITEEFAFEPTGP